MFHRRSERYEGAETTFKAAGSDHSSMRTTLFPIQLPLLRLTKQPDGLTGAASKEPLDEMLHNAAGTSRYASVFSA